MNAEDRDQQAVAAVLRATPSARVSDDFVARVNARIDETEGWLGLADFRAWTLSLVPAAVVLVLVAVLWPVSSSVKSTVVKHVAQQQGASRTFSPSSYSDWEQDVPPNALLEAALDSPARGRNDAR